MLNQDTITQQLALLAAHRRTLAALLQQQALLGGRAYATPGIINGIAEAQSAIRRLKEQLRSDGVTVADEPNDDIEPAVVAASSRLPPQEQRNRSRMLTKVKTIWIDGLLHQSLAKELRIALNLTEQPDAVDLPLNALVQELRHSPHLLPSNTPIITVFDQMGGALLILGAPGAGKTTLLLELARDLIARAEHDEGHPIPVVFNLSSWATKRRPLKEWLIEELNTKYDVPRKLAQAWMDADVVLPLLDGLDEVAAEHRNECVEAINRYRRAHGLVSLTVCSRVADYEALTTKLRLQGAVVVQALTRPQVDAYLERAGEKLAGVRAALNGDAELRELFDTPLMLGIATLAYAGKSVEEVPATGTPDERRRHLFGAYIAAMFQRRSKAAGYPQQQTLGWLSWLAQAMTRQTQTEFLVERLQPEWLPTRALRLQYVLLDRLVGGLVYGLVFGLVYGLVFGLVFGVGGGLVVGLVTLVFGGQTGIGTLQQRSIGRTIVDALVGGLLGGLVVGLVFGLSVGLLGGLGGGLGGVLTGKPGVSLRHVIVVERLRWVPSKAWRSAVSGLVVGLPFGLGGGLGNWLGGRLSVGLVVGLFNWLGAGLVFGLLGGLSSGPLLATIRVNQGIRRSARSALVGALVGALGVGLLNGLLYGLLKGLVGGLLNGLVGGLLGGLLGGLSFGGYTCLSHLVLRLVLSRNGSLPLRLVPFLDYCAERIFLRKVGGGYIFVHRLLMEHFAELERGIAE